MLRQKKNISAKKFFVNYVNKLSRILKDKHFNEIERISVHLEKVIKSNKNIFVCGNGGSASISNHFLCDFNKGIKLSSKNKLLPKVISLSNSIELISAISNDLGYDQVFENQLENFSKIGDTLIVISCSGKSKNILRAVKFVTKKKLNIISLIGFGTNSYIKSSSKYYINLNTKNYGITEDVFQSIMHMISQYLRHKNSKIPSEIL